MRAAGALLLPFATTQTTRFATKDTLVRAEGRKFDDNMSSIGAPNAPNYAFTMH
jgi:hypothetical protein